MTVSAGSIAWRRKALARPVLEILADASAYGRGCLGLIVLDRRQIVRCVMVILIGIVTISALVWLLAWSLAGESNAERRHIAEIKGWSGSGAVVEPRPSLKRAA